MNINKNKNGSIMALLPIIVYLVLSLGSAIILKSAKSVPALVLFMISVGICFLMNKELAFNEKLDVFARGAADPNIIIMVIIFLIAGAFTSITKSMGSVESVVNLSLSTLPKNMIIPGIFIVGSFISFAMGTSVGTIVALGPIAMGIAEKTGLPVPIIIGAVMSGAIFGDNLSIVSDTTIAATRLMGVEMKDKFRVNSLVALPAFILATVVFWIEAKNLPSLTFDVLEYSFIKIIPYLAVVATALAGLNVLVVLLIGIGSGTVIGLFYGSFTVLEAINIYYQGMMSMANIALIAISIGGIIGVVKYNGGIEWILQNIRKRIHNKKQASYGIALLVMLCEVCTGNNTVAIVTAGPIARQINDEYDLDPRKTAGHLDIFACVLHSNLPYSGNMLVAAGVAGISPLLIIPYTTYSHLLLVFALIAIAMDFPKLKPMVKDNGKKVSIQ